MHRCGLQYLPDVSGSRPLLRCYQTAAANAKTKTKTKATRVPKERATGVHVNFSWKPQEDAKPTERDDSSQSSSQKRPQKKANPAVFAFTRQLLRTSSRNAKKSDWKDLNAKKNESDVLRAKVTKIVPTEEKQQFMAANPHVTADDEYLPADVANRGTFVEIRRSAVVVHAVIIATGSNKGVLVAHSLATSGDVISHSPADIMFSIPNFIDEATVVRCGHEEREETNQEVKLSEHQIAARVQVLKQLTQLEKELDACYHLTSLRAARQLQELPKRRENWTHVSTAEIARQICGKRVVPLANLLAIHKFLMSRPKEYVAPSYYLITQTFAVRPTSDIENIDLVSSMIARRDPLVKAFLEKVKGILSTAKHDHSSLLPIAASPNPSITWTDAEQSIIEFLKGYVRPIRTIQKNPYLTFVAILIRWLGIHPHEIVNGALVHRLLVDIGCLAPWDDSSVTTNQQEQLAPRHVPDSHIHAPPSLGPEESYPRDIVAELRHDFGDMPVYVIDDATAEELDDGLSIERDAKKPDCYWVHVHVADPTVILHPTHRVSQSARELMFTHYFLNETIPMIPTSLTFQGGLSLGSGEASQNVLTFSMKVDGDGSIVDYDVRAGIIRNIRTMTYGQADQVLGSYEKGEQYPFGGPSEPTSPPPPFQADSRYINDLRALDKVTKRLTQRAVRDGVIMLHANKAELSITNTSPLPIISDPSRSYVFQGFPEMVYSVVPGRAYGSRSVVTECMKGAARIASRFFRDHNIPAIRRAAPDVVTVVPEDKEVLMSKRDAHGYIDFAELWKANAIFPSASYTLETKGHYQMGVPDGEGYVRITSPLRRFGDMVHHWQIKYALLGLEKPCFSKAWMKNFATEMGLKESALSKLTNRQMNFWAITFIKRYMDSLEDTSGPNPLQCIEAITAQNAYLDRMNGRTQVRAMIPSLGLAARVYDVPLDLEAGQTFKADYMEVRLGSDAVLLLKYRGI